MVAEDDIDAETLQAQIDVSMSFAHNLVTSWIKPTHLAQLRSNGMNATQFLEEELRRPPRLGVGASIPTPSPLAHETSKLKRKLGKHETKSGSAVETYPPDSAKSDDEEHKGRPTKRKTKVDPFGHESSKKKKKRKAEYVANAEPSIANASKPSAPPLKTPPLGETAKHSSPSSKKRQRVWPDDDQQSNVPEERRSATSASPPPMRLPVQTTFSPSLTVPNAPSFSGSSREASAPVPGKSTTPERKRVHAPFMTIPDKAKPLGIPLLNLDGPPERTDKPGHTSELNTPTKKRKRRKKKKKLVVTGTGEN